MATIKKPRSESSDGVLFFPDFDQYRLWSHQPVHLAVATDIDSVMETSSQNQQENSGSHSLFSEHQGTYFAYWLTQSTNQQNRISQTVA
ncbi:hypothetical protein Q4595_22195, partial [Wenyingzhuangia sp. 1_MG-2023]|nr:hypothetical protein [Wenyingzhuangia sp. 1_MG-2023]